MAAPPALLELTGALAEQLLRRPLELLAGPGDQRAVLVDRRLELGLERLLIGNRLGKRRSRLDQSGQYVRLRRAAAGHQAPLPEDLYPPDGPPA